MVKSFFELPPEIVDLIFNYAATFKEPKKRTSDNSSLRPQSHY